MAIIEGSEAALFVQDDAREAFEVLTCVGVENVSIARGDRTVVYCPSAVAGQYTAEGFIRGEPGAVTMPISRPLETVWNYLLESKCAAQYRLNWTCPGTSRHLITNYLAGIVLFDGEFTESAIESAAALSPDDNGRVNTTGQISALSAQFIYKLQAARQSLITTQDVNALDFLPASCGSNCGSFRATGMEGYAALDSDATGPYGDTVIYTDDGGATWTATTGSPFADSTRNATDVKVILTAEGHRVIVSGGAVAGQTPEIAYSDDGGETWTNVNPQTTGANGRGVNRMCWDKRLRLWAAADDGRIYVSENIGSSWSVAENGVETAEDLRDIVFVTDRLGYVVGNANTVLRTTDGAEWESLVGPATGVNLLTVAANRFGHIFVGTNDARVFRSVDAGTTWEEIVDFQAGSVDLIRFDPDNLYIGYLAYNNSTPTGTIYRTEDGGVTWVAGEIGLTTPNNAGVYAIAVCDPNSVYVGGSVSGGTSYIAKFTRRAS